MFSVTVRDHVMIAHSFKGDVFGPAQRLHGATYVVDVEFKRRTLDADGIVVDIGRATDVVRQRARRAQLPQSRRRAGIRGPEYDDRIPGARDLQAARGSGQTGRPRPGGTSLERIRVTLHESHVASASFEDGTDAAP